MAFHCNLETLKSNLSRCHSTMVGTDGRGEAEWGSGKGIGRDGKEWNGGTERWRGGEGTGNKLEF